MAQLYITTTIVQMFVSTIPIKINKGNATSIHSYTACTLHEIYLLLITT